MLDDAGELLQYGRVSAFASKGLARGATKRVVDSMHAERCTISTNMLCRIAANMAHP